MNLLQWFRDKQEPPQEPDPGRSVFSTHEEDYEPQSTIKERASSLYAKFTGSLIATLPKPVNEAGAAMDGWEDSQGSNNLKNIYGLSQPNISELLLMWYVSQSFIGHQMCAILSQNWLIYKACNMPARDAIRQGYELLSGDGKELDPKEIKQIENLNKIYKLQQHMEQFITKGRIFGIRIAIFKVRSNDEKYYEKPFNLDGVMPDSYQGIVQVDPYWCAPILDQDAASQPDSLHFYEPTWWLINGVRYHRTHLVIFKNGDLPDFLKPSYIYSGVPVPQKIMERVYAAERTANEGPLLAMTKRTTGFGTNIKAAYANKESFDEKMGEWLAMRDNNQVKIYDKTADELVQFDTTLSDLDEVIMTQYQLVAAASNVPATKLLGTTPKGFNATGEYEESSYHEELESIQAGDLAPLMKRHFEILGRSAFGGNLDIEAIWNPLDSPTAAEEAAINLQKAQTGNALVQSGAIDGIDERERVRNDKHSGYIGLPEAVRTEPEDDVDEENQATAE